MRKIRNDNRIQRAGDIIDVDVGIVTGRNEFFMINAEKVKTQNLDAFTKKVVSRSNHLKGIVFTNRDFETNSNAQIDSYLFLPPNTDFKNQPKPCKDYIQYGEKNDFHTGYKTRIRKRWYITPSLWSPDMFALRQVGEYPKLIINKTEASSTDTIHRVKLKQNLKPETVAISFLNSLSFAFSEITGRSYGGGVLTFEPTEIEDIPLPVLHSLNIDIKEIDKYIREREIRKALDIIDNELLIKQLRFTKSEVNMLRGIWEKLSSRRINRK